MKVLIINGSPRANGNTALALKEIENVFAKEGIEAETLQIGQMDIPGCRACGACSQLGRCVIDDVVNEAAEKLDESDGLVVASPVYYASANGTLISFLDRLFFSNSHDLRMKVGASLAVARRGGLSATYDELNKYFGISEMPIASSRYWNSVHGLSEGEAEKDLEGMSAARVLAGNMAFLMKSIALGKEKFGLPENEKRVGTNFIR